MSKPVKSMITADLQERYSAVNNAIWVELVGADGNTTNEFRRDLRSRGMHVEIVKNSLLQRACGDGPLAPLARALTGPSALVTGGETLIDAAKLLEEWLPKIKGLKLRGALLEGEYIDERAVGGLSKMPTKRDLQARISGIVRSPGANLAAAVLAGGGRIAACIKTHIENLEKGAETQAA